MKSGLWQGEGHVVSVQVVPPWWQMHDVHGSTCQLWPLLYDVPFGVWQATCVLTDTGNAGDAGDATTGARHLQTGQPRASSANPRVHFLSQRAIERHRWHLQTGHPLLSTFNSVCWGQENENWNKSINKINGKWVVNSWKSFINEDFLINVFIKMTKLSDKKFSRNLLSVGLLTSAN